MTQENQKNQDGWSQKQKEDNRIRKRQNRNGQMKTTMKQTKISELKNAHKKEVDEQTNQESDDQEDDDKNRIQSEDSLENQRTQYNAHHIRHICHDEEVVLT